MSKRSKVLPGYEGFSTHDDRLLLPEDRVEPAKTEVPEHDHPLSEHSHPHEHPLGRHDHEVGQHEHPSLATLEHREALAREIKNTQYSLRAEWRGAVRALLAVFEISNLNSEQRKAIHVVRVIIGDTHGSSCQHETTVYEEGDVLICQDCRQVIQ